MSDGNLIDDECGTWTGRIFGSTNPSSILDTEAEVIDLTDPDIQKWRSGPEYKKALAIGRRYFGGNFQENVDRIVKGVERDLDRFRVITLFYSLSGWFRFFTRSDDEPSYTFNHLVASRVSTRSDDEPSYTLDHLVVSEMVAATVQLLLLLVPNHDQRNDLMALKQIQDEVFIVFQDNLY